jgi:hypothetical protein
MIDPQQIAQASHIPQWLQSAITTAIGAIVGFISAMATEVWKSNRTRKNRVEALERALYAEMCKLYLEIHVIVHSPGTDVDVNAVFIKQLEMPSYIFAKSNPDIYYSMKYAFNIDKIYSSLRNAHNLPNINGFQTCRYAYGMVVHIQDAIVNDEINTDMLKEASPSIYGIIMKHIPSGDRMYPETYGKHPTIHEGQKKK